MQGMIVDWIAHNAVNLPNKTATIELPSERRQTYVQMHDRVGRVAAWLRSLGVERGDRVGVLALNSIDMLDIIFATMCLCPCPCPCPCPRPWPCVYVSVCLCVRVRACVRACLRARVFARVRVCVRACAPACVRGVCMRGVCV